MDGQGRSGVAGCGEDDVEEVRSLGNTLARWRTEILAHHDTGAHQRSHRGLDLCVKKVKRCGHGLRAFEHYPCEYCSTPVVSRGRAGPARRPSEPVVPT